MKRFLLFIFLLNNLVSYSQGEINWESPQVIAASVYGNLHPRIALDGNNNPMVIWGRSADNGVMFSKWDGSNFTTPKKINPSWLLAASATWMGPDIASKGDTVYVVVKRAPEHTDSAHIFIISSFDGGNSFDVPVRVSYIADSLARFPTVSIDDQGNPIVAFMKFNSKFEEARWAVSKSTDLGANFLPDIKASGWSGSNALVCDCCPGSIVSSGDVTAVVYRDNLGNKRDIWAGISTDDAESFEDGFAVDNGKWIINSCPASGPDAVIVGDSLYTVFLSGAVGSYRGYFSKSSNSKKALNKVIKLADNIPGLTEQNYPRIASDGKAAGIVWTQTVSGSTQLPILFTNDITKGFPLKYDTVDLGGITNSDIAIGKENVFVIWEDDNSGNVRYRKGSFEPLLTSSTNPIAQNINLYPNPVNDILNIQTTNSVDEIIIFNSLGERVYYSKQNNNKITTSEFPTGMYFLNVNSEGQRTVLKFIKQ